MATIRSIRLLLMLVIPILTASCDLQLDPNNNGATATPQQVSNPNTPGPSASSNGPAPSNDPPSSKPKIALDAPPVLPFPYALPNDPQALALTFDDGPDDYGNTSQIIATLVANHVPATFFINADNWSDIVHDSAGTQAVKEMAAHPDLLTIGNHTDHHEHLNALSADQLVSEISAVQDKVRQLTGQADLNLTQFRAPFGEPYQFNADPDPEIVCAVAQSAVHIGWGIDSDDWSCGDWFPNESVQGTPEEMATSTQCVIDNFNKALAAQGGGGIVLMHSPYPYTAAALDALLKNLTGQGYHFVSVETFIQSKFGGTSDQLVPFNGCNASHNSQGNMNHAAP